MYMIINMYTNKKKTFSEFLNHSRSINRDTETDCCKEKQTDESEKKTEKKNKP